KFSNVNLPTASVRPISVNARTTSIMTGATKNTASSTSAGPRNRAKLIRCRRSWARAKSGMANSWPGPGTGSGSRRASPLRGRPAVVDGRVIRGHRMTHVGNRLAGQRHDVGGQFLVLRFGRHRVGNRMRQVGRLAALLARRRVDPGDLALVVVLAFQVPRLAL